MKYSDRVWASAEKAVHTFYFKKIRKISLETESFFLTLSPFCRIIKGKQKYA